VLRTYALAPQTLRRLLRQTFWRFQIFVTASFLAFGLYLGLFSGPVRWQIAGPAVGVIALAYFFIIFNHYRQQLRILYSVRYEIDGSSIIYRQVSQAPIRISRADIRRVIILKNGLWVETVYAGQKLLIPYGLAREGDADFRATLEAWVEQIEGLPAARLDTRWRAWLPGFLAALLGLLFANSLWLILLVGAGALIYGLFIERRLFKNQDALAGSSRTYGMAFGFLFFILILKTCLISITLLGR
jgi:hypothetical protein